MVVVVVVVVVAVGDVTSLKMADIVTAVAVGDVIAICQPPAVAGMSESLQITVKLLVCSGHLSESVEAASPKIQSISLIGVSRGRRFICRLSSSSFSKNIALDESC